MTMIVKELTELLQANNEFSLRIILPSGQFIPNHFHVTEVSRIDKNFIDCGGTRRSASSCLLQAWTANDTEHRIVAGKLAKILRLAEPILESDDLPVEVEYGVDVASQYVVSHTVTAFDELHLVLVGKQTDCLAKDKCGVGECSTAGCCN